MYLAFANPHDPRVAAGNYMNLYQRDKVPLPKNFLPIHPFDNGDMAIRDEAHSPLRDVAGVGIYHLAVARDRDGSRDASALLPASVVGALDLRADGGNVAGAHLGV